MYRILIADEILPEGSDLLRAAPDAEVDDLRLTRAELLDRISAYDAVITRSGTPMDAELIARGPRLKVLGRAGLSLDNVDLAAATDHGLMVTHTPEAYSLSAAEHTLALLLALCRQIPAADASLRRGEWTREQFTGAQLHGKTLGLVGLGRVGRLVAARAQAFGMAVLAYDPYTTDETAVRRRGVTLAPLDELLAQADFVSLHAELTPETRHLLGAAELARLKPGARLINCARGELVDEAALAEALRAGRLAGAALDVFAHEPPAGDWLRGLPNVVVTPHLGASTRETQREASAQIARQVLGALRGTDYTNVVNLPFPVTADFARARPYLELAERIGLLQAQLADDLIASVEVEVKGADTLGLVKAVAVALLKGLLSQRLPGTVNYVNAPLLAHQHGVAITQARGLETADYANLISCRVHWAGGQRLIAGTLFGGAESRIVQLDAFRMDARPQGQALIMHSRDVPGVIGIVGTLLYQYGVNIAEWRLGRDTPGGTAVSFINLDSVVPPESLVALRALPQVVDVRTVWLA
ncbi:MAG: phosphoglycerate dehydrogenase [Anaerolineales bacterium]|nr:phosphoglycerate dehydrogenase [Anaerolineales bacterium]